MENESEARARENEMYWGSSASELWNEIGQINDEVYRLRGGETVSPNDDEILGPPNPDPFHYALIWMESHLDAAIALARAHVQAIDTGDPDFDNDEEAYRAVNIGLQSRWHRYREVHPLPPLPPRYRKQGIPQSLRTAVFERDEYRCRVCSTHLNLTVDHIIAESRGGTLEFANLQTLCQSCNSQKGAR